MVVMGDQTTRQAPPVRNHAPLPNAVVLFRVIDPIKSADGGKRENYAVAASQIAQPHCARCWAGFAALIGKGADLRAYLHAEGAR